jgi:hypothetical protein
MGTRLIVDSRTVWGFYPNKDVSPDFINYLDKNGWAKVPRVPVFRIPKLSELEKEHEYFLLDGNQRLNAAIKRNEMLPIILYEPKEVIDPTKDELSPSRSLTNPKRYETLIYMYSIRKR